MKKLEKTFFVQNLTEDLKKATSTVLVDFTGLGVKNQQELKRRLKTVGAKMLVSKNTLFRIAAKEARLSEKAVEDSVLTGPTALVITDGDAIAPLQIIAKFAKELEIPHFKVGIVEGSFQDKTGLERLSTLPAKEVLLGQAVGYISSPLYGLVGTLQGNLQKLLYILDSKAKS